MQTLTFHGQVHGLWIRSRSWPEFCIRANSQNSFATSSLRKPGVSWTRDNMIVHHSGCLHECITNCRTDKLEPAPSEIATDSIRLSGPCRYLFGCSPAILLRFSADKIPKIFIEGTELFLNSEKGLG